MESTTVQIRSTRFDPKSRYSHNTNQIDSIWFSYLESLRSTLNVRSTSLSCRVGGYNLGRIRWASHTHPNRSCSQDVGRLWRLYHLKVIDPIVVCWYGPQYLCIARPYNKATSDAEVALHIVINHVTLVGYDPTGCNTVLPVNDKKLSVFDLLPRCRLWGSVRGHYA